MRKGNQEPTFSAIGDYAYSIGQEVAEMFEDDAKKEYYPCQKMELEYILAKNADGSPAAPVICITKPRQNGKSFSARDAITFFGDFEHDKTLYSAHNGSTTRKMAKEIFSLFENPDIYPEFAKDVKSISKARGYEGIYFKDWEDENGVVHEGGCIDFATRTNSGARGGTYKKIVVDEAQELTEDQMDALNPVMSASGDANNPMDSPQVIYLGTPPGPSCRGTVFRKMRNAVKNGTAKNIWWIEWSFESDDIVRDIPNAEKALELAYKTNPAMGYRISEKTVLSEFETMSLDGFARERLNWWVPDTQESEAYAIDRKAWAECASEDKKPEGKTAFGVKFSPDGSVVSLAGAVIPPDGKARISLIEKKYTASGIRWLSDWLAERYATASCVVIDGRNNVDLLCERLSETWKMKGSVIRPTTNNVIASVSMLVDSINEQTVTWYKFQDELNDSAMTSVKRPISGGYGFGGDNSTPIEACALALWGAKTSKRDPSRKMRFG